LVANNNDFQVPSPRKSIWQTVRIIAICFAMGILALIAAGFGLVGTCTMIIAGMDRTGWNNTGSLAFGLIMEVIALLLVWGVYAMYKSQLGKGGK